MLIPAFTLRRCLLLGLLLVCLVKLADDIARYELRQAAGAVTLTAAAIGADTATLANE
ncbi:MULTISPECIES: hypothetical protein [unclassified Methylobacterium]|uniref:hypothetical protein n=1 Tax=unclassified Methylobacterium TaxID=2615210 RepID=UPI001FBBEFF3|nr:MULTISPECIES: hypothetical protein [unclassified Methylobacterium]MCJ2018610.1 hypothetical protein [Methylobacterium sp. E-065]